MVECDARDWKIDWKFDWKFDWKIDWKFDRKIHEDSHPTYAILRRDAPLRMHSGDLRGFSKLPIESAR